MGKSQHFGYYEQPNSTEKQAQLKYTKLFTDLCEIKPGMKVLDIGCGQGYMACQIAKRHDVHVTGITLVPLEVKKAKGLAKNTGVSEKTVFLVQDYNHMAFPDDTFDLVIVNEALVHSPNLNETIQNVHQVLKPGGRFVAADYEGTLHDKELVNFLVDGAGGFGVNELTEGNLVNCLSENGFTLEKELDWTENIIPGVLRLERISNFFRPLLHVVGHYSKSVNSRLAVVYADLVRKGLLKFKVYVARKL